MKCVIESFIKINQGSREDILVRLIDPETRERLDLTQFESGKAILKNSVGTTLEIALTIPGADPKLGVIEFQLTSAQTATFDNQMTGFEMELVYTGAVNSMILILSDSLEITERL